jgi:hypothetical protein
MARFALVGLAALSLLKTVCAQEFGEVSKLNTNLGVVIGAPLNPTAKYVSFGWGFVAGAGYNFNRRHAFVGEILWNRYYATDTALTPLRVVSRIGDLNGWADLIALTGNYRYELRGNTGGVYFIGGGGGYFRHTGLSREIASASGTVCDPAWLWWGFSCTSGFVSINQTLTSHTISTLGADAGVGFTVRVGDPPYRLYFESRYNYAPHMDIKSQFVTVTFGVRY